jgi:electron transport complex protein RnfE
MSSAKISYLQMFKNGIWGENPVFRLALSLCPAVAVTTTVKNGLLMGVSVLFVLVMVNITISLLKQFIHTRARFPIFMFTIATWVTVTDLILSAYVRGLYHEIGLYIQLIVTYAIVFSRAELVASKHKVIPSAIDGLSMGIGFTIALVLISFIREILGKGAVIGIPFAETSPFLLMLLPAGGFFIVGLLMALLNWIDIRFLGKTPVSGGGH